MAPLRVTATVITRNEEDKLRGCLETLCWADEIVVLDSGSADKTASIAAEFGAHVHYQEWLGYASQKNAAASLASNDWIFNIDADERVGTDLAREIQELRPQDDAPYSVVRVNDFLGRRHRPIHKPAIERLVRLYDRRTSAFGPSAVHEKVVSVKQSLPLQGTLYHEGFRGICDYAKRLNKISSLAASEGASGGARLVSRPFMRLMWTLFRHRLVLDGKRGFILAFMWAHHDLLVEAKRYERGMAASQAPFDPRLFASATDSALRLRANVAE